MPEPSQIRLEHFWRADRLAREFSLPMDKACLLAVHCNIVDPNGDDYKTPQIQFAELRNAYLI